MSKVLKTYRGLLRAVNIVFERDITAKQAAYQKIRSEYRQLPAPSGAELSQKLQIARDAAHILRTQIVQGVRDPKTGNYKLQIHKDTELGDNNDRFEPAPFAEPPSNGKGSGCCQG